MKTYVVTVEYYIEAKDDMQAHFRVWDLVNYGKEETAHSAGVVDCLKAVCITEVGEFK